MAHIKRSAKGWRVQIQRRGIRKSQTFRIKSAAEQWAQREEVAILDGAVSRWPIKTVAQALDRYAAEVTPAKKSSRAESIRLQAVQRHYPALSAKIISEVTAADLAAWRDDRLRTVTPGSVQRDINLLRNVWAVAAREWGLLPEPTAWRKLRLPGNNPPRTRVIGWREARRLLRRCGYRTGAHPVTATQAVGWALLISLRTGLRAGEITGLTPATVDLQRGVITLDAHKTAAAVGRRQVPLTPQAVRLLTGLPLPLPVAASSLDTLFRKARDSILLVDIHFHDARATALTLLARRVDVLTLARISGHQDLRILLQTYYRETASQIAARMAQPRRAGPPSPTGGSGG